VAEPAQETTELTAEAAAELLRSGAAAAIDVRRPYEWDAGRIEGARHIEVNELSGAAESIPRDRPVLFYCRSGSRSALAASAFRQAGWDAYNLEGGLHAWVERGLPLDPPDGEVAEPRPGS
jgi:rhodanese-related sulfurtransferase